MSLVAYASSDEGENSDGDEVQEKLSGAQTKTDNVTNGDHQPASTIDTAEDVDSFPIEDDEYDILPNQGSGLTLPPPKHSAAVPSTSTAQDEPSSILSGTHGHIMSCIFIIK